MPEKPKALEFVPSGISRKDTKVVITELKKIEAAEGLIRPGSVVEAARAEDSPLHKFFEWDNTKAAENYRQWQARQLVASVYVRNANSETGIPVRAFVNVQIDSDEPGKPMQGYLSQGTMIKNPGLEQQVLRYAKEQLLAWRRRFGGYADFYGVALAIDELIQGDEEGVA
jgi:hypothetical protein